MKRWLRFGRSAAAALVLAAVCAAPAPASAQITIPILPPAGLGALPSLGYGGFGFGTVPSVTGAPFGLGALPTLGFAGYSSGAYSPLSVVGYGPFSPSAVTFYGGQTGYSYPAYPGFAAGYGLGPFGNYLPQGGDPTSGDVGAPGAGAPAGSAPAADRMATVSLDVQPANAMVYVDERPVGAVKNVIAMQLPPGRHLLELRLAGYVPFARGLSLKEGDVELVHQKLDALK